MFKETQVLHWLWGEKILIQSFIYSNFEYCPLVWYLSSSRPLRNIERLRESALRFLFNDHTSSYNELLSMSEKCTMIISHQRALCIEIFKTVKQLNQLFMQNIFKLRTPCYSLRNPNVTPCKSQSNNFWVQ